jgi:hypothetical protein
MYFAENSASNLHFTDKQWALHLTICKIKQVIVFSICKIIEGLNLVKERFAILLGPFSNPFFNLT